MSDEMNLSVKLCTVICSSTSHMFNKHEVLELLSSGADIDFQDANRNFNTPLHLAIDRKNIELIKTLLLFNPNRKIRNMKGERARQLALNLNYSDIVEALDEHVRISKKAEPLLPTNDKNLSVELKKFQEIQSVFHSESYTSSRVQFLLSITKIDPHYKRTYFDSNAVKQIFVVIDENTWLRPLLKVSKEIRTLEIYFLYSQSSFESNSVPKLLNNFSEKIFVGGLYTIPDFAAIFAQKLFKVVMSHIYDNDGKPYRRKQNEKMIRFRRIVNIYKRRTESFDLRIQQVFQLQETSWESELISWVPYFITLLCDQPEKLTKTIKNQNELFDFYFDVVLMDIEEFLVHKNRIKFKSRPVEGSLFQKHQDQYENEKLAENYGSNYRHNKRNNQNLEKICSIL